MEKMWPSPKWRRKVLMDGTWYIDVYSIYPINCCHQQQKHLLSHRKKLFFERRREPNFADWNLIWFFHFQEQLRKTCASISTLLEGCNFFANFELGKIWGFNCFIMSLLFPKGGKAPNELPSWVCRFDDGCCVLTCFFLSINNAWRYPPGPQSRWNKHLIVFF